MYIACVCAYIIYNIHSTYSLAHCISFYLFGFSLTYSYLLTSFLDTPVRKSSNKFGFSLTYSYLCNASERKRLPRRRSTLYPHFGSLVNFCKNSKGEDNGNAHSVCTHACGSYAVARAYTAWGYCFQSFL